jgi:hypothetical protein
MEGLKKRAVVAVVILLAGATAIAVMKKAAGEPKDEAWMQAHLPKQFGSYRMHASADSREYSYKLDEVTYRTLEPYGIVARIFESSQTGESYDAVVIASRSKDSFHDPRVCFSAQGWAISNQWIETVQTKTRGAVPITLVVMDGPDGRNKLAAFIYKGQGNFYANTQRLKFAMVVETLFGGSDLDGAFYRFIPMNLSETDPDRTTKLKRFIIEYLDAANEASGGYF